MANFAIKLKLVLWKNFLTWKRHYMLSIFEILVPLLMFSMLSFVYNLSPKFKIVDVKEYKHYDIQPIKYPSFELYYTPDDPDVKSFIKTVYGFKNKVAFKTVVEMEKTIKDYVEKNKNSYSINVPVGVVFENFPKKRLPHNLKYQIRTDSKIKIESVFDHISRQFRCNASKVYFDKFIPTQHAIDMAFIKREQLDVYPINKFDITIKFQEMPSPPYTIPGQLPQFIVLLPYWTISAFAFMFPSVLKRIIEEKSTGIKGFMKMMGIDAWVLWLGWFIQSMVTNVIVITIIALLLSVNISENTRSLFENIEPTTLCMCGGMMIWLMTYLFFLYLIMNNNDPLPYSFYWYFVMVLPNVCLGYGFNTFIDYEFKDTGLTWSHFMEAPSEAGPNPSIGFACLILTIGCIIFLILTWYIENIFPDEYVIARPWYYPLMPSYWCSKKVSISGGHLAHIEGRDWEGFETVSADTSAAIQIRNLRKTFRKKPAVDNLSIDIYENEITVLLGHNGAGKTVTMNIITGIISPTSGTVLVNGYKIRRNINKIRESMAFCPQHNLQFSDLTVLEHLIFFAMLKGLSITAAKLESKQFLLRFNMSSKANKMASSLSGGMRRKLMLGMALVGHTRVLMLDEPTSGLDPEARREIWDLLLSMRGERTILITTHYMLEADILGDRIAIMHHGQLMCYGTSLFLKNHYGTGYTLSLLVTNLWNINTITEAIQDIVPNAVKSISAGFVTFALPTNDTVALSALFSYLEMNKSQLSISSFCVSLTTMEDVFLNVIEIADEIDKLLTNVCTCEPTRVLLTGPSLLCHQFLGLFLKRCQYACHRWIMFLLQVLIPLALVTIIMTIMKLSLIASTPVGRRDMVLNEYPGSKSFSSFQNIITNTPSRSNQSRFKKYYAEVIKSQLGIVSYANPVPEAIYKFGVADANLYHRTLIASAYFSRNGLWYPDKVNPDTKKIEVKEHIELAWPVSFTAMYGELALHGPPISLNLITNTALKMANNHRSDKISVENNPWPQFKPKSEITLNRGVTIMWIFLFPIVFTILVGFFLNFIHGERRTGVKRLQLMVGVPRILYWLIIYIFDLLVYAAVGGLAIVIIYSFNFEGPFGREGSIYAISSLIFMYGFAILPLSYILTYTSTVATSVLFLIWFHFLGTLATAIVISLEFLEKKYKEIADGLTYYFYIFPSFAFSNGIHKSIIHAKEIYHWEELTVLQKTTYHCVKGKFSAPCCNVTSLECEEFYSYFVGDYSIINNIISLGIHIGVLFFILFLFDSGIPRKCYGKLLDLCYDKVSVDSPLNQDVAEEQLRIQNQIKGVKPLQNDVLQVINLRKSFGNFHAVRGLNFGVKSRECVGLLGTNGAGKTTALKMLTGEILPTTGTANLMGYRLHGDRSTYLKKIGYCPQFDALNFTLTCRQTLLLFALLRGIPFRLIRLHIKKWMNRFDIKQYENIRCCNLSGGNKRKLSTVIALIGDPPQVMLDVPASGADPVSRRNLWVILAELRKFRQSIILTSQSMVESEALCDRMAIMVDGQLRSVSNMQYLKSKYRQGFTVMMKLKPAVSFNIEVADSVFEIECIKRKMESNYCCTLKEEHPGMLLYHVSNRSEKLGEVFLFMEGLKSNVQIVEGYTICDTSLMQEFFSFAKYKIKDVGVCKANANVPAAII